jgi:hypothetical protein
LEQQQQHVGKGVKEYNQSRTAQQIDAVAAVLLVRIRSRPLNINISIEIIVKKQNGSSMVVVADSISIVVLQI